MPEPGDLTPLPVIDALPLIAEVDRELIALLRALEPDDWARTAVKKWRVKDVAAHLLDGNLRRLSLDRDGWLPSTDEDLSTWDGLVSFLDRLNAEWTNAADRLSPRVLIDLLDASNREVQNYFASLDPMGTAGFPVSWAGQEQSLVWMDLARELTEKWHHQQQIRDAAERPGLTDKRFVEAVLNAFARALPRAYESVDAERKARVLIEIADPPACRWLLVKDAPRWGLYDGAGAEDSTASIRIPSDTTLRLFTKALDPEAAVAQAEITGPEELTSPFFNTIAIMG